MQKKDINKIVVLFCILIFMLSFMTLFLIENVYAQDCENFLGTFKQGECVKLKQICDNCTYVNVTNVENKDEIFYLNEQMISNGSVFYYNFCNTTYAGEWQYNTIGDKNGYNRVELICFEITPSGTSFNNSLSIPLFIPMILTLLATISFFILTGFVTKTEYKYVMLIFSAIFLIFTISFGIIASREILWGFPLLYSFVNSFYRIFVITLQVGAILVPIIVAFFIIKRTFNAKGYNIGGMK